MYQWVEEREKKGKDEYEYRYNKEWKSYVVSSDNFHLQSGHENPLHMPYSADTIVAPVVQLGGFVLADT